MRFASERAFTDAAIDLAKMSGWMVMHMRGNTHRLIQGMAGYPDLTLARRARLGGDFAIFEWWELKMPRNSLTEAQAQWGRMLHPYWFCFRPDDWDRMRERLLRPR